MERENRERRWRVLGKYLNVTKLRTVFISTGQREPRGRGKEKNEGGGMVRMKKRARRSSQERKNWLEWSTEGNQRFSITAKRM